MPTNLYGPNDNYDLENSHVLPALIRKVHEAKQRGDATAKELSIRITWQGQGADEKGLDASGKVIVAIDPRYFRRTEAETLLGDPSKAKEKLGWAPKTTFNELVAEMVREDLTAVELYELVKKHVFTVIDYHE